MFELTEQQCQELAQPEPVAVDPLTKTAYVLVRKELYDRIKDDLYDDSPWTDEEMQILAWEAGKLAGWDSMDEYDNYEKKP